eukprot:CAMPEP_0183575840 /NCGR_PEP_ID=MMETSP0371-20130417/136419_1 /TAXON_ID=268820 /ORGANISM="Peridinium aciculiferum, Strain PAER-2" /LENGTH=108 /DNA_ID=CAMNT_0025786043 /DNA_START=358 /DNA_END=681 /DNA_ORIENTATION=-
MASQRPLAICANVSSAVKRRLIDRSFKWAIARRITSLLPSSAICPKMFKAAFRTCATLSLALVTTALMASCLADGPIRTNALEAALRVLILVADNLSASVVNNRGWTM